MTQHELNEFRRELRELFDRHIPRTAAAWFEVFDALGEEVDQFNKRTYTNFTEAEFEAHMDEVQKEADRIRALAAGR
ncbi:hypothetical protein BSZ19_21810 [Bradyrhizobium japonicum]|uniref:Uncharacterized protein n=1 Tax=Bradyrhizobium japonicum TaxID=375 RepID=A0A1Y2JLU0_BRAJP|nr:hypothetical protein [Bradyrhizobium japonicum]OSJ31523.1 hypothetical protein BSZ19_21810 [Bradyrhizobium japonicum]